MKPGISFNPRSFKKAIGNAKKNFSGYSQHDSTEFLNELLDTIHEDLNRVKNKQFQQRPDPKGTEI